MSAESQLRNVIVFGAGGTNIGHWVVKTLSADSSFKVTVLARASSKTTFASNVSVIYIDETYPKDDLVAALKGQDVFVSASGAMNGDIEYRFIDAAAEAGVKRYIPSQWGIDNTHEGAQRLSPLFADKARQIKYLQSKEHTGLTWTAVATGMWLDWALDPANLFADINITTHTATIHNTGAHKGSWTTLPGAAEAVHQILLHPTPADTANRVVKVSNLDASHAEILTALENTQRVKYQIDRVDDAPAIAKLHGEWDEKHDVATALTLVKYSWFDRGYGSGFKVEGDGKTDNELLGVEQLDLERVVADIVKRHAA